MRVGRVRGEPSLVPPHGVARKRLRGVGEAMPSSPLLVPTQGHLVGTTKERWVRGYELFSGAPAVGYTSRGKPQLQVMYTAIDRLHATDCCCRVSIGGVRHVQAVVWNVSSYNRNAAQSKASRPSLWVT